jgi:hypothetical protein
MQVEKKHFPKIMKYNDELYFAHLEGIVESVDELCSMQIIKDGDKYIFRISPSIPKYTNLIIDELFNFHNRYNIRLDMSKSIKTTALISFKINLENNT